MRFSLFLILLSFGWTQGGHASSEKECYPGLLTLLHKGGEDGEEFSTGPDIGFFPPSFLVASKLDSMPSTVRMEPILEDTVAGFRPNKPSKNQVRMKILQHSKGTRGSESNLQGNLNFYLNENGIREVQEFSLNRSGLEQNDEIFGNFSYSYMQTGQRNPEIQKLDDFNHEILDTEEDVTLNLAFATHPHLISMVKHVLSNLPQGVGDRGFFNKSKTEIASLEDLRQFVQNFEIAEAAKSNFKSGEITNEQLEVILAGLIPHGEGRIEYDMKTKARVRQIQFRFEHKNFQTIKFEFDHEVNTLELTISSETQSRTKTEMVLKFENPDLTKIKTLWLNKNETVPDGEVNLDIIFKIWAQNGHFSDDSKIFFIGRGLEWQKATQNSFVSFLIPRKLPEIFKFADREFRVASVEKAVGFDVKMAREFLESGFVYPEEERAFLDSKIVFSNGKVGFVFRTEFFDPNVTNKYFSTGVPMYRVFIPADLNLN